MFKHKKDLPMSKRKIITVGFELASTDTKHFRFSSVISLLDWDIILFKPDIEHYVSYLDTYQGKPCLSDDESFRLKEKCDHWRREIKDAFENGKTVIVFLSELTKVSIATGEKKYSGTGRNQRTTRIVTEFDNYKSIPLQFSPISTKGSEMKLAARGSELISSYWKEFSNISSYKVVLTAGNIPSCLLTKNGDKTVGAIYRSKNSAGALILVPDIDFYPDKFITDGEWTDVAVKFASQFVKAIVSMDKTVKNVGELTPEPIWSQIEKYKIDKESDISGKLLKTEDKLEKILEKKENLLSELKNAGRLRNLLFEKGKPLEYAILEALKIIGFSVSQYDDGQSEFDAIFESKEGSHKH
jgi:hypothetical protein